MELILEKGSPANAAERLEKEQRCYKLLDELGIEFWRVDHEAAETMEACIEIDAVMETAMCKNLLLTNRKHTEHYLLMMPGDKKFKTKELPAQLGCERLSFAHGEEMEELLDITPGSLSVLGLMNDKEGRVQLIVDEDILKDDFVGCHPCINTSSLKIKKDDLFGPILSAMNHKMRTVKLLGED